MRKIDNCMNKNFYNYKQGFLHLDKKAYEISVVVVTYKPDLEKTIETIQSILKQKNVEVQVIISDDGSEENYFAEMKQFFMQQNFNEYHLISCKKNQGTVKNVLRGVKVSSGEYIKTISPGDRLYNENVLRNWLDEIKKQGTEWSFSDALYYSKLDGMDRAVNVKNHPADIRPYIKGNQECCRWNYCVLDDIALGAAILCKREVMLQYLERIVGKVVYAEDNIWRIMMFDGIIGSYYPMHTVLYEYGGGISTSGSQVWEERLGKDWDAADQEMIHGADLNDHFQRKALKALKVKKSGKKIRLLLIRGKLRMKIYKKLFCRGTPGRMI